MFSLVYRSVATPVFGRSQIQEMLEKARQFNQKNKITGCLLYYQGEFIQYIEGSQVKVLKLFDKIQRDDRHTEVEILSHSHIEGREFEEWHMAYEDFARDNDDLQFLRLLTGSFVDSDTKTLDPNPTSTYFWRTAKRLLNAYSSQRLW